MRTFRLTPALIAGAVFLVIANALLIFFVPEPRENSADDEAQLLYYAMLFESSPPPNVDQSELERMFGLLDPKAHELAERFSVISYDVDDRSNFELKVRHQGDGTIYVITINGVGYGS